MNKEKSFHTLFFENINLISVKIVIRQKKKNEVHDQNNSIAQKWEESINLIFITSQDLYVIFKIYLSPYEGERKQVRIK